MIDKIAIIGLGYVGLPLAIEFSKNNSQAFSIFASDKYWSTKYLVSSGCKFNIWFLIKSGWDQNEIMNSMN